MGFGISLGFCLQSLLLQPFKWALGASSDRGPESSTRHVYLCLKCVLSSLLLASSKEEVHRTRILGSFKLFQERFLLVGEKHPKAPTLPLT